MSKDVKRRTWANSLRVKVTVLVFFCIVAIDAVTLVPSYLNYERDLLIRVEQVGRAHIISSLRAISHARMDTLVLLGKLSVRAGEIAGGSLYYPTGKFIGSFGNLPEIIPEPETTAESDSKDMFQQKRSPDGQWLDVIWPREMTRLPVTVVARLDASSVPTELRQYLLQNLALFLFISIVVCAATMFILDYLVLRRVRFIESWLATVDFESEATKINFPIMNRKDELGSMALALHAMVERTLSSFEEVRNARANLRKAHDLLEDRVRERTESLHQQIEERRIDEKRFQDFADSIADFYWEMDDQLRFSNFSDRFTEVTGVDQTALLGKTRQETGVPGVSDEAWEQHLSLLDAHKPFRNFEHSRVKEDGNEIWLSINGVPVVDGNGKFQGYRGAGLEITKSKESEQALQQEKLNAEKANAAKSEFLSSMSHELRTPMNAILGFGQMLEIESPHTLTDQQKLCIDHILSGGKHLLELIDQVLDLATIESGHVKLSLEDIALDEVCLECMSLIENQAHQQGLSIDKSLDAPRAIKADYTRLKQVLLNLLSNAIKYNRNNGSISIAIEDTPNGMVRVSVTDTGNGIPKDLQPYLFEPFNRLGKEGGDIEGSGIGLTITKTMVEAMGGRIGLESQVGKGSTFWLEFSRIELDDEKLLSQVDGDSKSVPANQPSTTGRILYVEDNPANVELMKMVIGTVEGLSMTAAHNAERGIIMAEESLPNLILMDINLPGMNGIEAMKTLQVLEKTKDIPVIAITAAAMEEDIKMGEAAGFKAYLTKPFNIEEILSTINEILDVN